MLIEANPYKVFAGSKGGALAGRICEYLGCEQGKVNIEHFSDGEFAVAFEETVRGMSVYLVQSTCPSTDNLMELLLMIDAAKRASAYKVIAVIPYFGWARQDRKDKPRVSIGAKLCATMLEAAGADRVITLDLHADQIQGFFDIPVDHLYASNVFAEYIASLKLNDLVIASPDEGGTKRSLKLCKNLQKILKTEVPMVICYKQRLKANMVSEIRVLGDIEGKDVVLCDDICDTAGTLCKAAAIIKQNGAKSVRAVISHGVLSGPALERIENSVLEELIITDSLEGDRTKCSKIKVLNTEAIFGKVITAIQTHTSVSEAL